MTCVLLVVLLPALFLCCALALSIRLVSVLAVDRFVSSGGGRQGQRDGGRGAEGGAVSCQEQGGRPDASSAAYLI